MRTGEWASSHDRVADAVVIGGGTVGGWCAWWLRQAGVDRVAVIERSTLGRGASSRAAGMVRSQGGTPTAVRLGMWSRDFYLRQAEELGIDSGFVPQGYFMPAFDAEAVEVGRARVAMQQRLGLEVEWLTASQAAQHNPTLAPDSHLGGSYAAGDGYLDPPRNVLAYSVALARAGVRLSERTSFLGLQTSHGKVVGVETSAGTLATERVVLTGGPDLASVGRIAGVTVHAGGTRHQVAVTEPHPAFAPDAMGAMVFDVAGGLYWRPEEGGLLFGMSNPDEPPGEAREIDWHYLETMRARLAALVPLSAGLALRRAWAATIDYTPDHLPILGPAIGPEGPMPAVTVASAGGHGMMWGPAVARVAADLCLCGRTSVIDDVSSLGLDRFDAEGRSRLESDPIALPFPERIAQQ
ncbi:MAG: FAD-binding oxidoreductase [Acidimicrobiales bacterium]